MAKMKDARVGTVEAAKLIGVSAERLRYWEYKGIVKPTYIRCGTRKFRRFSPRDIKRAVLAKLLVDDEKYSLEGAIKKLKEK
ncbi:MAG: MerR family transcriptional regulator [Candidatus Lokiarchaeia archaeon]